MSEDTNVVEEDSKTPQIQIGPRVVTRFEMARVLGARALQISMGAPVLVETEEEEGSDLSDPLLISQKEIEAGLLPIMIRRFLPDGRYQDIPLRWLLRPKKASASNT
ncbi:MAG: DNA-directed RNA polymerase subunit K [Candidatus Thorarchaeota archaeon]